MGAGPPRMFYGWIVLTCVSTVLLVTYGVQYAFGVFFTAMLHDLGWSRARLAGAFSLYSLVYISVSLPVVSSRTASVRAGSRAGSSPSGAAVWAAA